MNEFLTVLLSRGEHKLRIIEEHAYRIILSFTFVSKRKYLFPPPPFDLIIERFNLIVMKKKKCKLSDFCCFPASLAIVAASLFALQTDDRASSFIVTRGEAFYMQVSM